MKLNSDMNYEHIMNPNYTYHEFWIK